MRTVHSFRRHAARLQIIADLLRVSGRQRTGWARGLADDLETIAADLLMPTQPAEPSRPAAIAVPARVSPSFRPQ